MPKKKPGMTPEEQSEKFREAVRELEAAGELNPIEADEALDRIVKRSPNGAGSDNPNK
jgi:hypothetical protein